MSRKLKKRPCVVPRHLWREQVEILIRPKDFKYSFLLQNKCALSLACKRHFKTDNIKTEITRITIDNNSYLIKGGFDKKDHDYVKWQYARDPEMKKAKYYATLIPNPKRKTTLLKIRTKKKNK